MIRKKYDGALERQFLQALIYDKAVLGGIGERLDVTLLPSADARRIAAWCLEHLRKHRDAPGGAIQTWHAAWVQNDKPDPSEAESALALIETLTPQPDAPPINSPLLISEFTKYLNVRNADRLRESLALAVSASADTEIADLIANYRAIEVGGGMGFTISGHDLADRVFAEGSERLITYPGAMGEFFRDALCRDALIGLQAPEKRAKTFWCLELAFRALRGRLRVAFFEVGDLSERQIALRMYGRMAELPRRGGIIRWPTSIEVVRGGDGADEPRVDFEDKQLEGLTKDSAYRGAKRFWRHVGIDPDSLMVYACPSGTVNVGGIERVLDRWKVERNFDPDITVIDYADILAPEAHATKMDGRDQINQTWLALRRLSSARHQLVIVPTQASAASYTAKTQSMRHFSNDKRKHAHVTGMIGINQTPDEKAIGVQRLNWIVLREDEFHTERCVYVAQCLPLGMAYVCAAWGPNTTNGDNQAKGT
jgi:hypothetical protein